MNEETLHDKLEQYVRGLLSPPEVYELESELATNADLQEQLRLHRLELEGHEYLLREKLRENVGRWIADEAPQTSSPRPASAGNKWKMPLLLLALFSALSFWFFFQHQKAAKPLPTPIQKIEEEAAPISPPSTPIAETEPKNESPRQRPEPRYLALAKSAYKAPPNIGERLLKSDGPSDQGTDPLSMGIRAYQAGQYQAAVQLFDKITAQNNPKQFPLALEWKAHAWYNIGLQKGDFKPAAAVFQAIVDLKKGDVAQDRAEWFLLLSLVPEYPQKKKQVDQLLESIIKQEYHSYLEDAEKMKQALQKKQ